MNNSENFGKNLIIIEKYEEFVNYIYPILQNVERKIKRLVATGDKKALLQFFGSWGGHIRTADSFHLTKFINREYELCKMKLQLVR